MPRIVTLNVSTQAAPTPSNLQQMGAIISQGATTLTTSTYSVLPNLGSLTSLLAAALSLTSLAWSSGTVVATTSAAIPGLTSGDTFITTITGVTPAGYNGTYLATVTGTDTFTFALTTNPGTETIAGTYTPPNQVELVSMATECFAQNQNQAIFVLELGAGDGSSGPSALQTWITNNPGVNSPSIFYVYLCPKSWDGEVNFVTLAKAYESDNSMVYFVVSTTTANYAQYNGIKSVLRFAPYTSTPITAFDAASLFDAVISNNPGPSTPMSPLGWRQSNGTTAWPQSAATTTATLDTNYVNYVTTGAQGGLPNTNYIANGYTADGTPFQWWYSVDYAQLNLPSAWANAIINASNDGAPIDYDQSGVDTLQDVGKNFLNTMSAGNLIDGTITGLDIDSQEFENNFNDGDYAGENIINAVPFATYIAEEPDNYIKQLYGGFALVITPTVGIQALLVNLTATQFA